MTTKTFKVSLSLDNPRIIQSGINVHSFDKQSIKITIELTKNSQVYQIPTGAQIKISLLKLARQEQKIILDVPFTNADSIDWVVPDYLDGYQGEVRVGIYLIVGTENIDVGYFNITSSVSDIDSAAEEFTESVLQGWAIEDLTALLPQFQAVLDETTGKDVISAPEIILARGGAQTLGERLEEDKAEVTAQLAQTINPQNFEGTDAQKIQQAIQLSRENNKAIAITGIYDLKGETIYFDKPYYPRSPLRFVGSGTIMKSEDGFMFSSHTQVSGDIFFDNIYFTGVTGKTVRVFDCRKVTTSPKIISVHTTNCFFTNLDVVYYSPDSYMQTITMKGDTFIEIETAVFEIAGAAVIKANQLKVEDMNGSFIKHRINGTHLRLEQVSITDCCMQGLRLRPVFDLENSRGLTIRDIYFENNPYGDIIFSENAILTSVTIENVSHYAVVPNPLVPAMIVWGSDLNNCKSFNNYTSDPGLAINDTTQTKIGVLQVDFTHKKNNITPVNNNVVEEFKPFNRVDKILDVTGSPGSSSLYAGDEKAGFFGLVRPEEMGEFESLEMYSGSSLATALGFAFGVNQNDYCSLAKYIYNGKILFVPLHAYKRNVSYDQIIQNANNKTIKIGRHNYNVRLMWGVTNSTPQDPNSWNLGIIGKGNEYNDLILPMMKQAEDANWTYEEMARNSDNLRIIPWGLSLTNEDLKRTIDDHGSYVWVQGLSTIQPDRRITRGYFSVEYAVAWASNAIQNELGWLPVLELIKE